MMLPVLKSTLFAFTLCLLLSAYVGAEECTSVVDVVCGDPSFTVLCDLVSASEVTKATLDDGNWTIFAPTDEAFDALDADLVDSLVNCTDALNGVLAFHVAADPLFSTDLVCGDLVPMANGDDSRTVCKGDKIYQKGSKNSRDAMPEIIASDIEACDSVIHVVDQVMLPKAKYVPLDGCSAPPRVPSPLAKTPDEEPNCQSIAEIACASNGAFSILCDLVTEFDLIDDLTNGTWTVFAPTDDAFNALEDVLESEPTIEQVSDILAFHAFPGEALYYDDLVCKELLGPMANGDDSRTKCIDDDDGVEYKYQKGAGQIDGMLPKIIIKDIRACNGIVHVVDNVMLPKL